MDEAAEIFAALTEPPVVYTFIDGHGWSFDRWHEFTNDMLAGLLLRDGVTR